MSHGLSGEFKLGNEWIGSDDLADHAEAWHALDEVMNDGGNIYLYGCNVAEDSEAGQALLDGLAEVTHADVFASYDVTGACGDWDLEAASTGDEAELERGLDTNLDADELADYADALADYSGAGWSGAQTFIDGAISFTLEVTGGGTIDWSYDGTTDTLTITDNDGTSAATSVTITDNNGGLNVDSITTDMKLGSLTCNTDIVTLTMGKAISNTIVGSGSGTISSLIITDTLQNETVNIYANISSVISTSQFWGGDFNVTGDVGSIDMTGSPGKLRDSSITVNGDLDSINVQKYEGTVSIVVTNVIGQFDMVGDYVYSNNFTTATYFSFDGSSVITDANEAPTVSLSNLTATLSEDTDTTAAIKVADITLSDDGLGTNNLTLAGADAASFEIVGSELRLKAGTALDFETKASFDVTVQVDDAAIPGTPDDTALHTLNITDANEAPSVVDDNASGNEDTVIVGNVLSNDSDVDGDTLTASLVSGPAHGSLTLNVDGNFSYTPDADWNGTDSFTYTTNDGALDSNVATMTITVNPVNDAPTVPSSAVTAATEDAAYSCTITTRDVDGDVPTIMAPTLPAWLTLVDNKDGTATLSGTPTNADVGDHSVELEIDDGALTELQDFTLTVSEATIDPPVDDADPDLRSSTNPDPKLFEDPETDDVQDPGVAVPTSEEPATDPVIEDKQAPPVEEHMMPQGSADADDQLVHIQDPEIEENEEIIYLTDEMDTDIRAEEREDDLSLHYFDNDLYKDLFLSKYLAINYTAADEPIPKSGDDLSILDLDNDDPNQVEINGDYDVVRQEIDDSFNTEMRSQAVKAKIVTISAATFAAGVVSYLIRVGSMVSSLMSSLPLWRGFDPIAIFSGDKKRKKDRNEMQNKNEPKSETLFDGEAE
jgi:VCBS repeat-containing protein